MLEILKTVTPSPEQWEIIIEGMRNPMNSWDMSDSNVVNSFDMWDEDMWGKPVGCNFVLGDADRDLMERLNKGGAVHAKYRRMIPVFVTINAPLYWWKEFDTYKVGTVCNSCSTMHKIHAKEFTLDDFSFDQLMNTGCTLFISNSDDGLFRTDVQPVHFLIDYIIPSLNVARERFLETKDKADWWQMIQLLPTSYNQRRTVMLNYEVLANMYYWRKRHKLDEWHTFCDWIESLPHSFIITGKGEDE